MPAGRPPKPTALKQLQGTARPDRLNPDEPAPVVLQDAQPPAWLKGRARKAWRELAPVLTEMGVLTVADRAALALLCDTYGDYLALRETVEREGRTYTLTTKTGDIMPMPRPEVSIAADAWKRASAMLQQFRLTPASRSKVSATEQVETDPFEQFLKGRP